MGSIRNATARPKSGLASSPDPAAGRFKKRAPTITLRAMDDSQGGQSSTREQLRLALFPDLSPEEGKRRIDAVFARAEDDERVRRIERLANAPALDEELLRSLRRLSTDDRP
jgi:hypothetical protein